MTDFTKAQQRLIDKHRDINVDYDWWGSTYDAFVSACRVFGIEIETGYNRAAPSISFELNSQGAGATFATEWFTLDDILAAGRKVMTAEEDEELHCYRTMDCPVAKALRGLFLRVEQDFGTYSLSAAGQGALRAAAFQAVEPRRGELTVDYHPDYHPDYDAVDETLAEYDKVLQDLLRDVAHGLYTVLDDEYDALTSAESVWEAIVANELDNDDEEETTVTFSINQEGKQ